MSEEHEVEKFFRRDKLFVTESSKVTAVEMVSVATAATSLGFTLLKSSCTTYLVVLSTLDRVR